MSIIEIGLSFKEVQNLTCKVVEGIVDGYSHNFPKEIRITNRLCFKRYKMKKEYKNSRRLIIVCERHVVVREGWR